MSAGDNAGMNGNWTVYFIGAPGGQQQSTTIAVATGIMRKLAGNNNPHSNKFTSC
jgi:hypothetical protein